MCVLYVYTCKRSLPFEHVAPSERLLLKLQQHTVKEGAEPHLALIQYIKRIQQRAFDLQRRYFFPIFFHNARVQKCASVRACMRVAVTVQRCNLPTE